MYICVYAIISCDPSNYIHAYIWVESFLSEGQRSYDEASDFDDMEQMEYDYDSRSIVNENTSDYGDEHYGEWLMVGCDGQRTYIYMK